MMFSKEQNKNFNRLVEIESFLKTDTVKSYPQVNTLQLICMSDKICWQFIMATGAHIAIMLWG